MNPRPDVPEAWVEALRGPRNTEGFPILQSAQAVDLTPALRAALQSAWATESFSYYVFEAAFLRRLRGTP